MDFTGLSTIEAMWPVGWNIAAGRWGAVGLGEDAARQFLASLASKLRGDRIKGAKKARARLQQHLMARGQGSFEQIQQEAPFRNWVARDMDRLLNAGTESGPGGFDRVWYDVLFAGNREAETQVSIRIIGENGDSREDALEVVPKQHFETGVAAEWWWLFYSFGELGAWPAPDDSPGRVRRAPQHQSRHAAAADRTAGVLPAAALAGQ